MNTPPAPRPERFSWDDFLSFRYLITPGLVKVIYVIGALLITLAGVAALLSGQGAGGLVAALLIFIFGNLYWRVILEFIMVLFRINDSLASIDRRGGGM
jgi:hypothetical protein